MSKPICRRLAQAAAAFLLLNLLFAGCRTTPKIDWDSRVGHYTYDQAVAELGPPDKSAKLSDGKLVAEWLTRRGRSPAFSIGTGVFGRHSGVSVGQTVGGYPSGNYLRLVFGTDNKLVSWTQQTR